jgi:hypothetical protein
MAVFRHFGPIFRQNWTKSTNLDFLKMGLFWPENGSLNGLPKGRSAHLENVVVAASDYLIGGNAAPCRGSQPTGHGRRHEIVPGPMRDEDGAGYSWDLCEDVEPGPDDEGRGKPPHQRVGHRRQVGEGTDQDEGADLSA